jgi:sec-independent protein translocase protein TatB
MFDIGASELLVIVIVAIIVIGPKDMPLAMRTAGRWIGKIRRVSSHFRSGIDAMVREAELEEMEKKWKAQNEEIMRRTAASSEAGEADQEMTGPPLPAPDDVPGDHGIDLPGIPDPQADAPAAVTKPVAPPKAAQE